MKYSHIKQHSLNKLRQLTHFHEIDMLLNIMNTLLTYCII